MEKGSVKQRFLRLMFISLGVVLLLFLCYLFLLHTGIGLPCPFERLTGLRCPGCGNTRAVMAYLRFDFLTGFWYNLLFPLEALYLLWVYGVSARNYLLQGKFHYDSLKHRFFWIDILVLALILSWWILRNFLHI